MKSRIFHTIKLYIFSERKNIFIALDNPLRDKYGVKDIVGSYGNCKVIFNYKVYHGKVGKL